MSKGRVAIGTVLGAAAGVIAGLLTAPKSGQETREDLKIKANELRDETARRAQAARDAKKPIDSLKQQTEDAISRGKETLREISGKK